MKYEMRISRSWEEIYECEEPDKVAAAMAYVTGRATLITRHGPIPPQWGDVVEIREYRPDLYGKPMYDDIGAQIEYPRPIEPTPLPASAKQVV